MAGTQCSYPTVPNDDNSLLTAMLVEDRRCSRIRITGNRAQAARADSSPSRRSPPHHTGRNKLCTSGFPKSPRTISRAGNAATLGGVSPRSFRASEATA